MENPKGNLESTKFDRLKLKTEKIIKVSDADAELIGGGSTCRSFTCDWCTSGLNSEKVRI